MTCSRVFLLIVLVVTHVLSGGPTPARADDFLLQEAPRDWDGIVNWLEANPDSPSFSGVLMQAVDRAPSLRALDEVVGKYFDRVDSQEHRAALARAVGSIFEMGNRFSSAADWYRRALEDQDSDPITRLRMAGVLLELGSIAEAIENLTEVIQRAPHRDMQRSAAILRARAYMLSERLEKAREHTLSLAGDPEYDAEPAALFLLLEIAQMMQDRDLHQDILSRLRTAYRPAPETFLADREVDPDAETPPVSPFPTPSRVFGGARRSDGTIADRPQPEQPPQPQPQHPDESTPVAGIQTGSFRDRENAQYMVRDIEALGFAATIRAVETNTGTFYRVVIPIQDPDEAETQDVIVRLKEQGIEGFLVFQRE